MLLVRGAKAVSTTLTLLTPEMDKMQTYRCHYSFFLAIILSMFIDNSESHSVRNHISKSIRDYLTTPHGLRQVCGNVGTYNTVQKFGHINSFCFFIQSNNYLKVVLNIANYLSKYFITGLV